MWADSVHKGQVAPFQLMICLGQLFCIYWLSYCFSSPYVAGWWKEVESVVQDLHFSKTTEIDFSDISFKRNVEGNSNLILTHTHTHTEHRDTIASFYFDYLKLNFKL